MATVLDRLNFALHHAMESDERVYVLGEDIVDPYGGAFKVTARPIDKIPCPCPYHAHIRGSHCWHCHRNGNAWAGPGGRDYVW